jgi:hypothetical protein
MTIENVTNRSTDPFTRRFPLPGSAPAVVVARSPGSGRGYWAGAPCVLLDDSGDDAGEFVIGYRVRHGNDGVDQNVVARSADGETLSTVFTLDASQFGVRWMERPALVRTEQDGWRMFVCTGDPQTKAWQIHLLEADDLAGLASAEPRPAFPSDARRAVKDPIVRRHGSRWEAWICCHPLDVPGAEDRMSTAHATSDDGLHWREHGTVLAGRPGMWDARGARLTEILPDGRACYDGRATVEENWFERVGLARTTPDGKLDPLGGAPVADVRYLTVLPLPTGSYRIYYEARLPDESHELRTELVDREALAPVH